MRDSIQNEHHLGTTISSGVKEPPEGIVITNFVITIHCMNILPSVKILLLLFFRHFEGKNPADAAEAAKLFSVPDFVGDACKAIASRVRGAVASVQFDDFHKVKYY